MKGIILAVCGAMVAITLMVSAAPAKPSGDMVYTLPGPEHITPEETTAAIPETTILETTSYYNVNLSREIQDVIFAECKKHDIPPRNSYSYDREGEPIYP